MKGKINRLSRILNPETGRSLIIAVDHGMALGPMTGIENPGIVFEKLDQYTNAWLMTKGIFTHVYEPKGNKGIILRASGAATIAGPDLTRESGTASVEELSRFRLMRSRVLRLSDRLMNTKHCSICRKSPKAADAGKCR